MPQGLVPPAPGEAGAAGPSWTAAPSPGTLEPPALATPPSPWAARSETPARPGPSAEPVPPYELAPRRRAPLYERPTGPSHTDREPTRPVPAPVPGPGVVPAGAPAPASDGRTAEFPGAPFPTGPVPDGDRRRRERAAARRRAAAEVKRSRAAQRRARAAAAAVPLRRADQHRTAQLLMIMTLGLLIASVVVTGGLIATSRRARPVALAAPLQVFPVVQTTPGQCPAGTQGITGQAATGPACYRLSQGIAIRKVADLRVQRSRTVSGGYDVAVTLRPVDRRAFAGLTRATVGRDLAFVVRDRLVTLPRVEMAITDGKVVVAGPPDRAAADRLVRELKGR